MDGGTRTIGNLIQRLNYKDGRGKDAGQRRNCPVAKPRAEPKGWEKP
jgi:hypothetical protein